MQCLQIVNNHLLKQQHNDSKHDFHADDIVLCTREGPSPLIFFMYAFIVPTLAAFGLCANFINAIVFMRPKMTPSAFTYLAALSFLDCTSCLLITMTALSRSVLHHYNTWLVYDFVWQMALFGMTTGAANLILACVSFDRLIYLWQGIPTGTPSFCRRKVARYMIALVILVAIILNMPYFFVFDVHDDNTFQPTEFYYTRYYRIHNWVTFLVLAICPAIFLLIGNAAIIIAFRRWTKQSKICQMKCGKDAKTTNKRYQHQMKLTVTILIVISLYMIGELPAHLTSWKCALNLLFGGDISKIDFKLMEKLEVICITLNALQLSMNIIVYAVINPSFMPEFFTCLRGASDTCFHVFGCTAMAFCWRKCCHKSNANAGQAQAIMPVKCELPHDVRLCMAEGSSSSGADMMTAEPTQMKPLTCKTQICADIKTISDAVEHTNWSLTAPATVNVFENDVARWQHSGETINVIATEPSWHCSSSLDDFSNGNA